MMTGESIRDLEERAKVVLSGIAEGFRNSDPQVPDLALGALLRVAKFAEEAALELATHPDPEIRSIALQTLEGRDRSKSDVAFRALADEHNIVQAAALNAIELFGCRSALDRLRPRVEELSRDPYLEPHVKVTVAVLEARVNAWPQLYGQL